MQNILQCICQDRNQPSYKVLLNTSPSSLYNALKCASETIYRFTLGFFFFNALLRGESLSMPQPYYGMEHKHLPPKWNKNKIPLVSNLVKRVTKPKEGKLNDSFTFITYTSKLS